MTLPRSYSWWQLQSKGLKKWWLGRGMQEYLSWAEVGVKTLMIGPRFMLIELDESVSCFSEFKWVPNWNLGLMHINCKTYRRSESLATAPSEKYKISLSMQFSYFPASDVGEGIPDKIEELFSKSIRTLLCTYITVVTLLLSMCVPPIPEFKRWKINVVFSTSLW